MNIGDLESRGGGKAANGEQAAMDCTDVRDQLEAYLSGELEPRQAANVAEHLDRCGECTAELDELTALTADLRHAGQALRPVHSLSMLELQAPREPRRRRRWPFIAASAAAAALVVWAMFLTVVVLVPGAGERLGFLPAGRALHDARQEAARNAAAAERLRAAGIRLQDRLTAIELNVPVAAVRAAREYLETVDGSGNATGTAQSQGWTLARADGRPPNSFDLPPSPHEAVTLTATAGARPADGSAPRTLRLRVSPDGANGWTVTEVPAP